MIPGNPLKILLIDDRCRAKEPLRYLRRKGYDAEVSEPEAGTQAIIRFWPDIIAVAVPWFGIEKTIAASPYLRHMKVIRCHD